MKTKKFAYSLQEMTRRLLAIGKPIRKYLVVSTLSSIIGNLGHIGLMGFGAAYILVMAGAMNGNAVLYLFLAILSGAAIAVCRYLEGRYSHIGAYGLLAGLRVHLYNQISRISPAFLVERKQGDLLNIAVEDVDTLEYFFAHTIGPMFTVILLPLTTLIIAYNIHPLYCWALLPIYILISIVLPLISLKAGRGIGMRYRSSLGELKSMILESVYGMRDIEIFGYGEKRKQEVLKQNDKVNQAAHGLVLHQQTVSSLPNFFVYLARILIIFIATQLAGRGLHDPCGSIIISFVAAASFSSTFSLTFVVTHLLEAYAAAERIFIIEDTQPAVKEAEHIQACGPVQSIAFENVTFAYPKTERKILNEVSFTIHQGDKIGILGESGTGKSTLFRLLLRFYDPTSGRILFNGIDERNISFQELHQRIAMLEQDTYLFDASIAANIAVAEPDASIEKIQEAAKRAGIADFIDTLPEGYETQMGQMGSRLSGGERQRIGIARIMLADPDVIVMDEPTSALDALHEKELLHTLHAEYQQKTIIMISHRMSTLADCTRLLEMKDGRIKEESTDILKESRSAIVFHRE